MKLSYILNCKNNSRLWNKNYWTSKTIRSSFIDYFRGRDHKYIRSSPVIPWKDSSISFVNAGMIQFKPILLGHKKPHYPLITNSQKCIRLGGKHNDLEAVGLDTYHHTFFEMLGSWSFGKYFKKESCALAWRLLTEIFSLPPENLYVTYFGGCKKLNIPPDLEVYDIWASIGVPKSHILPFGVEDNFWEMGPIGPCGPCTEIHFDRVGHHNASELVNKGSEEVIELWNLVFIQYERFKDGSLSNLKMNSVDTGMGLERLTAILNGKTSNYDTDLFLPLFDIIQKESNNLPYSGKFSGHDSKRDTAYRIIADHSRMLTVSLADGIIPSQCPKWKRILQRTLTTAEDNFGLLSTQPAWLENLMEVIADSLGDAYPELWGKMNHSKTVLREEIEDINKDKVSVQREWNQITKDHPSLKYLDMDKSKTLVNTVKLILAKSPDWQENNNGIIPVNEAVELVIKNQNDISLLEELGKALNLKIDIEDIENTIIDVISSQKLDTQDQLLGTARSSDLVKLLNRLGVCTTDDSPKYIYKSENLDTYIFDPHHSDVLAIVDKNNSLINKAKKGDYIGVILKSTNFYHTSGGQENDLGNIFNKTSTMQVDDIEYIEGYIIHWGKIISGSLSVHDNVECVIDDVRRMACTRHHTAVHLLNAAIKSKTGATTQISSSVTSNNFELTVFLNKKLKLQDILDIEERVKTWISLQVPIEQKILSLDEALRNDISFIPGFVYPPKVNVVTTCNSMEPDQFNLSSNEMCCGTHLLNTEDMKNFLITDFKQKENGSAIFTGICGKTVDDILQSEEQIVEELNGISKETEKTSFDAERYDYLISRVEEFMNTQMSYNLSEKISSKLDILLRKLKKNKDDIKLRQQIQSAMNKSPDAIIIEPFYSSSKKVELERLSRICKSHPTLLLNLHNNEVYFRVVMPKRLVNKGFSAAKWGSLIAEHFDGYKGKERTRSQSCEFQCNKIIEKEEFKNIMPLIKQISYNYLKKL